MTSSGVRLAILDQTALPWPNRFAALLIGFDDLPVLFDMPRCWKLLPKLPFGFGLLLLMPPALSLAMPWSS